MGLLPRRGAPRGEALALTTAEAAAADLLAGAEVRASVFTVAGLCRILADALRLDAEPALPGELAQEDMSGFGRMLAGESDDTPGIVVPDAVSAQACAAAESAARIAAGRRARAAAAERLAERRTTAGGTPYRAIGAGDVPFVVVNALGQGTGYWWRLAAELARTSRVLLWDQRTDGPLESQLADLADILAAEGAQRAHLIAWCTGVKIATGHARRAPDAVASITMLGADFKHDGRDPGLETPYDRNLERVCRTLADRPQLAERMAGLFDTVGSDGPAGLAQEIRRPFSSGSAFAAYAAQMVDFWAHDELRWSEDVRCPVLFLQGDRDTVVLPEAVRAAAGLFPDALRAEVRGGSHYLMYDRAELVAAVVGDFVRDPAACADRADGLSWTG